MNNTITLYFVTTIHIIVIMLVLLIPFTDSNYLLTLYVIFIPFMVLHWILNDNTCCLTVMEKTIKEQITGKNVDKNDCITYKLISPIYDFNKNHKEFETFTYSLTFILWLTASYKLYDKYSNNEITSFESLITI